VSPFKGPRRYYTEYAVIYKTWAYINAEHKKRIGGKHFDIVEEFQSRPEEMPESIANSIMEAIKKNT
jgi:hypothetical protein